MDQYYYIDASGDQQASGSDYSGWELDYFSRIDGTIDGYPADGQSWDFTNHVWYYKKAALKNHLKSYRQAQVESGTSTYNSASLSNTLSFLQEIAPLVERARVEDSSSNRAFFTGTGNSLDWTNADVIGAYDFLINRRQNYFDAELVVFTAIDGESVTDPSGVESAFTTALASPISRDTISDVYATVTAKQDESSVLDAVVAAGITNNEMILGDTSGVKKLMTGAMGRTLMGAAAASDVKSALSLAKSDVGLGSVDNTADASKSFTASQVSDFSTAADARITAQKGAANGLAPLDSGGKVASSYLPNSVMEYQGAWNPSTNSPSLADGTGNNGDVYRASAAATRNLGSGNQTWAIGDLVIYNGSIWQHSPAADGVSSVFGRTGAVASATNDYNIDQIADGTTNKLYTATEKTKLSGIATGATANSSDATLLARANHTGTQTASTISDFTEASQDAVASMMTPGVGLAGSYDDSGNAYNFSAPRTTSTLSLSLVGTGATGTQIHATKDSSVRCSVSTSTTSTIGGPSTSVVVLKICATNSSTEGDWTSVATFESDQTITLAIALQSIQIVKGQLCADVPAGWYVKLVNSGSGTHSETFVSGQKTIYG